MRSSALRYSNRFRNASATNEGGVDQFRRLVTKLVAMATSLERSQNEQKAFEKRWAHSPLRAVLHCHSPGVATVARRRRIDVNDNDNA